LQVQRIWRRRRFKNHKKIKTHSAFFRSVSFCFPVRRVSRRCVFSFGTSSMLAQPIAATIAAMMQVEVKEPPLEVRSAAVTIGAMNSVIAVPSVPQPYRISA
jgi:hypothetical protein